MIWFQSDTHFTHANIIKYCNRPFTHVDEMDAHLISKINQYVKADDVLYHLGDFAFNRRSLDVYYNIRKQIKCKTIHFVFGNHDDTLEQKRDHLDKIFASYPEYLKEITVNNQRIVCCHYALSVWNKSHKGAWNLYGHSHSEAEDYLHKAFPNRRSMDVGVDNAYKLLGEYRPFSFDEIKAIMDKRGGCVIDHHSEDMVRRNHNAT
jgi:calcineurin-like phosphoesterase family protein